MLSLTLSTSRGKNHVVFVDRTTKKVVAVLKVENKKGNSIRLGMLTTNALNGKRSKKFFNLTPENPEYKHEIVHIIKSNKESNYPDQIQLNFDAPQHINILREKLWHHKIHF